MPNRHAALPRRGQLTISNLLLLHIQENSEQKCSVAGTSFKNKYSVFLL
jgi:hypothetical protein